MYYSQIIKHTIEQMLEFLPDYLKKALRNLNLLEVYEIRLRAQKPIVISHKGKYRYLANSGLTNFENKALIATISDISESVYRAGKYSVYSIEEELKKGFLTAEGGVRIGLCGEYVFEKGQPLSIRNITSLCIRIPHEVKGAGEEIYNACLRDRLRNLLIISAPGLGKTTILRDLSRLLGEKGLYNILICDERGEIAVGETGRTCDIISYADKKTAFEAGIRAMRPDVIITDELSTSDCIEVEKAKNAGVIVFASAHIISINEVRQPFLRLFDRFIVLSDIGKIQGIYGESGEEYALL